MYEQSDEKKLVGTLITGKPSTKSYLVASMSVLLMILMSLFYWYAPSSWAQLLTASKYDIFQRGQLWRIFTAIFVHADIEHLMSNMLLLWIFSFFVFGYFGLGVFPFLSFILAAVVNALAVLTYEPKIELIGASGLVYLLGGLWLTLYVQIQRQYSVGNRLLRVIGIALMIFVPSTFIPSTSYRTHAIGFLMGILMGFWYFYKNKNQIRLREVYWINQNE